MMTPCHYDVRGFHADSLVMIEAGARVGSMWGPCAVAPPIEVYSCEDGETSAVKVQHATFHKAAMFMLNSAADAAGGHTKFQASCAGPLQLPFSKRALMFSTQWRGSNSSPALRRLLAGCFNANLQTTQAWVTTRCPCEFCNRCAVEQGAARA